ncbi:MAG: 4Fe-4S dicluster domain-containing protein [Deltaproteobacteria bacterium]|nr:4Fe-4S dicluster domain-containing protein [Deltaproteobacteria bacterium]
MENLTIDPEKCTACRACELACSYINEGFFAPSLSRIRLVRFMDQGLNVPVVCVNCVRPACVEVCPNESIYIDRSGPVVQVRVNDEECTGCGECVKACPFGAVEMHPDKEVAYLCDLCGGEPACVASCIYGALTFRPKSSLAAQKRRTTAESFALSARAL